MAAKGWVTITKWISAVSGSKVTEIGQLVGTHCRLTLVFLFVDATFYSGDVRCRVRKSRKKWYIFYAPNLMRKAPSYFLGAGAFVHVNRYHFRTTDQVWLTSHGWSFNYADEIKKMNYSGKI